MSLIGRSELLLLLLLRKLAQGNCALFLIWRDLWKSGIVANDDDEFAVSVPSN